MGCGKKKDLLQQHGYSQQFADDFLMVCTSNGGCELMCQRTLEKVVVSIPASELDNGQQYLSPERSKQIATYGMSCVSEEELRAQMVTGCLQTSTEQLCECTVDYVLSQFSSDQLRDILLSISDGNIPP